MTPAEASERFNPYAIMRALQDARVDYVLIGGLARVIQGSDETTDGFDLVPSRRLPNLRRLDTALQRLGARGAEGSLSQALVGEPETPASVSCAAGGVVVVLEPAGTRGYEDLRRRATRAPLGEGLRPLVAVPGDLVRMLEALGRPRDELVADALRRIVELDRGLEF